MSPDRSHSTSHAIDRLVAIIAIGQGAWCEAAWDDRGGECERRDEGRRSGCQAARTSQICRCKRECADGGPWECHEEGCPARLVTCQILSGVCGARFSDIWRKSPQGVASLQVAQACPLSCQRCISARLEEERDAAYLAITGGGSGSRRKPAGQPRPDEAREGGEQRCAGS